MRKARGFHQKHERYRCDGCGRLRQCMLIHVFNQLCKICVTCLWNATRWQQRPEREGLENAKCVTGFGNLLSGGIGNVVVLVPRGEVTGGIVRHVARMFGQRC